MTGLPGEISGDGISLGHPRLKPVFFVFLYPLVMTNIAIEHGPCIVS